MGSYNPFALGFLLSLFSRVKEMCDVANRKIQTEHEQAKEVGCSFARSRLGMAFMSC